MPKILITGNGFDLHHGLPTTYSDFIKITEHITTNIYDYQFDSIYKKASNYKAIAENFNKFEFDINMLSDIRILAEKNLLFNFFNSEYKLETWIDFEIKIELIINSLLEGANLIREKLFNKNYGVQTELRTADYRTFDNNIFIIDILTFFNIIIEYPSDRELFIINEDFLIKRKDYLVDIDEDKISSQIYSQLIEFKKIFNLYILTFVNPLLDNIKKNPDTSSLFQGINFHFTFNYTPTFEKLLYKSGSSTNFLHGKCDKDKENIIFGINDISSIQNNGINYLKFTKYYQKLNGNTDYSFLSNIDMKSYDKYIFYLWGHSLDKSDASYINEIFEVITVSKSDLKKIIVIYHNEHSRSKMLLNLLAIRGREDIESKMRAKELIFAKLDSPELKNTFTISTNPISVTNLL
ncbi:AbiH family protein [Chryseobacterium gambrini]|uniref:AbiH family protein n=1 Tax=Chryseobacterium gambrini TaxID=373672 RepID=UPI0022F1987C|nr:AbiH family protein [Chryseobacterium gambrini]WBV54093.1 AbiH family protein [Chryseobacterium gambrini]